MRLLFLSTPILIISVFSFHLTHAVGKMGKWGDESTFFRVLACTLYLSFKNVLVLVPKYITKYFVLENKYIASTSHFVQKIDIII